MHRRNHTPWLPCTALAFTAALALFACGDSDPTWLDASFPPRDSGPGDSGALPDGAVADTGSVDTGTRDGSSTDGSTRDGATLDGGARDGASDAASDSGATDAGATTAPRPGELVIVEVMGNPQTVTDEMGEYFEVINVSGRALDLSGVRIAHAAYAGGEPTASTGSHAIAASVIVAPGARALLGVHGFVAGGGVTVDYVYGGFLFNNGGTFSNRLRLLSPTWDGTEPPPAVDLIDEATAPAGTFDNPLRGRAWQLDPALAAPPTASGNDDPANYCWAPARAGLEYRANNWGTPRAANDCSP